MDYYTARLAKAQDGRKVYRANQKQVSRQAKYDRLRQLGLLQSDW